MSDKSAISWTDATWNPVTGCSKVSPGCAHCYAEALTKRYAGRPGWPAEFLPWTPENAAANVVLHPERLDLPLHWRKPKRIFVNALSDLFHEDVPDEFIDEVLGVTTLTGQHTFQVLTKRPERMRAYFTSPDRGISICRAAAPHWPHGPLAPLADVVGPSILPLENVQLGVSVENQRWADVRIDLLLQTPAAVRFISAEPLLGQVWLNDEWICQDVADETLNWVIVGGESGPGRREMDLDWLTSLVQQCRAASVPVFVKQDSGAQPGKQGRIPDALWVKEFPDGR